MSQRGGGSEKCQNNVTYYLNGAFSAKSKSKGKHDNWTFCLFLQNNLVLLRNKTLFSVQNFLIEILSSVVCHPSRGCQSSLSVELIICSFYYLWTSKWRIPQMARGKTYFLNFKIFDIGEFKLYRDFITTRYPGWKPLV